MNNNSSSAEVWIGLAEVRQRPGAGVLLDRNEAIVNVLALAISAPHFASTVRAALEGRGFDLVELEDSEPFSKRVEQYAVDEEISRLAEQVRQTGFPQFGTFHTWISDE